MYIISVFIHFIKNDLNSITEENMHLSPNRTEFEFRNKKEKIPPILELHYNIIIVTYSFMYDSAETLLKNTPHLGNYRK